MRLLSLEEQKEIESKIDKIQKIDGFPKAVDSLYIKKNVDLYITGSNANLLSSIRKCGLF